MAKPCDTINEKHDGQSLVSKMLRHCHRGKSGLPARERGRVRRRDHDDRPCQTLGTQIVLQKLPDLPAPLANERQNHDVALAESRKCGQERGFPNPGSSKKPQALPLTAGREQIQSTDTKIHARSQSSTLDRGRRRRSD